MVADPVENSALCELYYVKQNPCTDMASMRLQAKDLYALQDYIDAQFKGSGRGFFRIVKARVRALEIMESRHYAATITSHSWGDPTSTRRIQALGGAVAFHVNDPEYGPLPKGSPLEEGGEATSDGELRQGIVTDCL